MGAGIVFFALFADGFDQRSRSGDTSGSVVIEFEALASDKAVQNSYEEACDWEPPQAQAKQNQKKVCELWIICS